MRNYLTYGLVMLALVAWPRAEAKPREVPMDKIELKSIDGKAVKLSDTAFGGKVLLIVNTASECGYTPQYEGLEKIHKKYSGRGFAVLGFPSNDFGGQEPGSDAEIKNFCTAKFKIDFPMFTKGPVKGAMAQPLYQALIAAGPDKGEISWNFEKFLLSREHKVLARFKSGITPESPELVAALEKALGKL